MGLLGTLPTIPQSLSQSRAPRDLRLGAQGLALCLGTLRHPRLLPDYHLFMPGHPPAFHRALKSSSPGLPVLAALCGRPCCPQTWRLKPRCPPHTTVPSSCPQRHCSQTPLGTVRPQQKPVRTGQEAPAASGVPGLLSRWWGPTPPHQRSLFPLRVGYWLQDWEQEALSLQHPFG